MTNEGADMKGKAYRICRDYLSGAWKLISAQDMIYKQISGGLSNFLYYCGLPASTRPRISEPSEVLLRIYGRKHHEGPGVIESIITDSVIFTLLSERRLGPGLYGVFPGGRIEEYIPARSLRTEELSNPDISVQIAEKMAKVHTLNVPISKEPSWLWDIMDRYLQNIRENMQRAEMEGKYRIAVEKLKTYKLDRELEWLRRVLRRFPSPVVFAHNDMQGGNILYRESPRPSEEKMILIDFEFCSYNYRGFDLANHFCEWMYDYTSPTEPYYNAMPENFPSKEQQMNFIQAYLHTSEMENSPLNTVQRYINTEESILQEVQVFMLASHFLWGLWAIANAQVSKISFGYWEYGVTRFDNYFAHKLKVSEILKEYDSVKRKSDIQPE